MTNNIEKTLLESNPDSFTLFHFYLLISSGKNPFSITNNEVLKQLKWGKNRLTKAKRILIDKKIIKEILVKNKKGQIVDKSIELSIGTSLTIGTENHPTVSDTDGKYSDVDDYLKQFNALYKKNYQKTKGRVTKYNIRLRTYTHEQILKALENMSNEPFYHGDNERGWEANPDFLIRNDEQVDRFLNLNQNTSNFASRRILTHDNAVVDHSPCSELDLYNLAKKLEIAYSYVTNKHKQILSLVESGDFQKKYSRYKSVKNALEKWLEYDISQGRISHWSDTEQLDVERWHPDEIKKRKIAEKIYEEMYGSPQK